MISQERSLARCTTSKNRSRPQQNVDEDRSYARPSNDCIGRGRDKRRDASFSKFEFNPS